MNCFLYIPISRIRCLVFTPKPGIARRGTSIISCPGLMGEGDGMKRYDNYPYFDRGVMTGLSLE